LAQPVRETGGSPVRVDRDTGKEPRNENKNFVKVARERSREATRLRNYPLSVQQSFSAVAEDIGDLQRQTDAIRLSPRAEMLGATDWRNARGGPGLNQCARRNPVWTFV
jgi:hypothetical protein